MRLVQSRGSIQGERAKLGGKRGEQDSEREKKREEELVKSLRKENPILRVSARNEAGSRDFGTDSNPPFGAVA